MTLKQGVQQVTQGGVEWWYHAMNRMVRCRTVPELLDLAYDALRGGLGYNRVCILMVDPARRMVVPRISTDDAGRKVYPAGQGMPLDGGLYDAMMRDPRLRIEGPGYLYLDDPPPDALGADSTGDHPAAVAPRTLYVALRTHTAVRGLITITPLDDVHSPDPAPVVALATALAAAVENALHADSLTSRPSPAAIPHDAAGESASHLDDYEYREQHDSAAGAQAHRDATLDDARRQRQCVPARPWHERGDDSHSERDAITGLLSRRAVFDHLRGAMMAGESFALLLLDIDNFRLFNDTHGHTLGDHVLGKVARILRQCCGAADVAGRYGNDEFVVLLHHATVNEARLTVRRVETALRAHAYVTPDGSAIPHSFTVGLACFPVHGRTPESLIATAEQSLAAAKRGSYHPRRRPHAHLLEKSHLGVLTGLVTAVDCKDRYTRQHSEDVTRYALLLAEALGLDAAQRRVLALAGPLHDVGKIAVPDRILRKPGKLTREEFEQMKHHVSFGVAIIQGVLHDDAVLEAVAHHHERWDGRGYPAGLPGARVSLLGRIMQIADAVSAMRQSRPYRQGLPWTHIVAELRTGAGVQFDPDLVEAFISVVGRLRA